MERTILADVQAALEESWQPLAAETTFLDQLRQAAGRPARWVLLPVLCCAAAGGAGMDAHRLAAAWMLTYRAARLIDHVQDGDAPDPWWESYGPGVALNAAVGLFFSASRLLNLLEDPPGLYGAARAIRADFAHTFLDMSAGQQKDLTTDSMNLASFWEIARAKSGAFFGLACQSGARLATADSARVEAFRQFGEHLGILIQIGDEQEDVMALNAGQSLQRQHHRMLPVVYALEVMTPESRLRMENLFMEGLGRVSAAQTLYHLLEEAGAGLYLAVERERQRAGAAEALARTQPEGENGDILASMLSSLVD